METKKIEFPILLSEDRNGLDAQVRRFIASVNVAEMKQCYSDMKFDVPFDNIWPKLCTSGVSCLQTMAHEKQQGISRLLGIPDGIMMHEIIKHANDKIARIQTLLVNLGVSTSPTGTNYQFNLSDTEIIDGSLVITAKAYEKALKSTFSVFINDQYELDIKNALDEFAISYNSLVDKFKALQLERVMSNLDNTYLARLYEQKLDNTLNTRVGIHGAMINFLKS